MIRAGIDIGTNTILLLVAELGGADVKVIEDHVRVVRLGQGVDKNRAFAPEAMQRARDCFADYQKVLAKYPGIEIRAFATSGSRDAKNSVDFFKEIERSYNIPIKVISGDEEALLSFKGALPLGTNLSDIAVIDIGGGSTELVTLLNGKLERFSFDLGCVRLTEKFLSDPPTAAQLQAMLDFIREQFAQQPNIFAALNGKKVVGVAGTVTYLASSAQNLRSFEVDKVDKYSLTLSDVEKLCDQFKTMTAAQRLGIGGMDKGRADVIVGGAYLLREFMTKTGTSSLRTSVRGLRYGAVCSE